MHQRSKRTRLSTGTLPGICDDSRSRGGATRTRHSAAGARQRAAAPRGGAARRYQTGLLGAGHQ